MLEHFNDYISIGILLMIIASVFYLVLKLIFNTIERNRIRKQMQAKRRRNEDQ